MRFLLIAAALGLGWYGYLWLRRQPPATRWRSLVLLALLGLLGLALSGRLHWLVAAGAAALPLLRVLPGLLLRLLPAWLSHRQRQRAAGGGPGGAGRQSVVESRFLRMTLEHDSGEMDGEVLSGAFAGSQLSALSLAELRQLLATYQREDEESAALLLAWLQRVHGDEWQQQETPAGDAVGEMSRAQALAVLGLEEGADAEEIRAAHRRLIQQLHPDRGGSSYLAAQVNKARSVLLAEG